MGLSQSLYSGISGLKTHQVCMDNIGNNLANVNTTAFKKGVFQFRTLLEQTLRGGSAADADTARGSINPLQVGLGTQVGSILKNFSTGSVEVTGNARDMMIDGNGFYVLRNGNSNVYTRDGTFFIGADGSLMYNDGLYVQGIMADKAGAIKPTGSYTDVKIPIGQTGAAIETTKASFTGNLNSNVEKATGLKLASNANGINMNEALSKYLGEVKDAARGVGEDDNTWNALTGNSLINGGTVWTTSSFGVKDPQTGAMLPAQLTGDNATRLEDLWYLSGTNWTQPFKGIDNPPTFTISGVDQTTLTNWQFEATGYRQQSQFNYQMTEDPNNAGNFVIEIFDRPYEDVINRLISGVSGANVGITQQSYAQALEYLLATSASDPATARSSLGNMVAAIIADTTTTPPINVIDGAGFIMTPGAAGTGQIPDWASSTGATGSVGTVNWAITLQTDDPDTSQLEGDYTPQGTDLVTFGTTLAGINFAAKHDATLTTAQARTAFDGSVKFGNQLLAGSGVLNGYTPKNVDQTIQINYLKGGREYTAEFEYSDKYGNQSYTIEHLMKFLCGTVDSTVPTDSVQAIQTQLQNPPVGGIMGTIQLAGKVTSSIDGGEYGYNVPPETAGAFTRNGITNTVSYAGQFKTNGTDSSQLSDLDMDAQGYALKQKWYYAIEAFLNPAYANDPNLPQYQYAVTTYSDSARTNPVSTSNKMLGSGDLEMRRSIQLYAALGKDTANYAYQVVNDTVNPGQVILQILDDKNLVIAQSASVTAATINNVALTVTADGIAGGYFSNAYAAGGGTPATVAGTIVGRVSFTTQILSDAGSRGEVYMGNMGITKDAGTTPTSVTPGLAEPQEDDLKMFTTMQGITYGANNGIGQYSALSAFDMGLDLGAFLSATDVSTSYGTFDTAGQSTNYSIVSNLGIDNAITDISFSYNSVSYNDIWTQDTKYSAEQGGSSTTNIVVYDSLGNPKEITITMTLVERDSAFSTYRWYAESRDDTDAKWYVDPASKEIMTNSNVGTGTIRFDAYGQFVKGVEYSETAGISLDLEMQGVHDVLRISQTEGLAKSATQKLDFSFMTQVAAQGNFNLKEQDGSAPGTLNSFTTTPDGIIQGIYSNGVVRNIARLALALVPNETGLMSAGGNLYYTSPSSGEAQIALAGVGGRGTIRGSALETSNVDLSEEFTKLITTQRGFQANSKIISTSDEMLQELVNLKR